MYRFDKNIRLDLPEKMDEPGVTESDLRKAHSELRTINRFLGGHKVLLSGLDKIDTMMGFNSIIDVGCGNGENLRCINDHYTKKNQTLELKGVDINPSVIRLAEYESKDHGNISYHAADVWDEFGKADVVTCSLFCHHFNDRQIVPLLKRLHSSSNRAVLINDLDRHWFAYHSISVLTSAFSGSDLVKYDAPLSVARAFTRNDWNTILTAAGFRNYELNWKWAWRWQVIIWK